MVSSTSSTDSKERNVTSKRSTSTLERPLIGRPRDTRERCMSVSLVVGNNGLAQVRREEVEVEFLNHQKELDVDGASLMKRMVSSAGSEASVSRTLNNLSLVNSTRGEVLVRSASQQTDLSHSVPLTPITGQSHLFVSPMHLRKDSESMIRSSSMIRTPESPNPFLSDTETEGFCNEIGADVDHAQLAVKKLLDRKRGNAAKGFVANSMPLSPMALPRTSQNVTTCGACQIVFRSREALVMHSSKCSIKQTPFVSADYFEPADMFQLSEDMLFMSSFTNANLCNENFLDITASLPLGSLLEPSMSSKFGLLSDADELDIYMSPRKKSRLNDRPQIPTTPTRA